MKTSLKFKCLLAMTPMFLLAACGGGDDSIDDRIDVADPKVRLVHAVPLGARVSLFRNDVAQTAEVTNVPYLGASNYFDVDTGSARWDVRTTSGALPIGTQTFDATRGNKFTLVAVPGSSSAATDVMLISDPYNRRLNDDDAHVRVLNAAFNAPDVDVYITAPGADINTATPNFGSVDYRAVLPASGNDSIEFDGANTYQVRITAAGSKTVVFNTTVTIGNNADWLLTIVPNSTSPNDVKVLRVEADSSTPAAELTTTP